MNLICPALIVRNILFRKIESSAKLAPLCVIALAIPAASWLEHIKIYFWIKSMAEKSTPKPKPEKDPKWSTGAKVGAAVGSAALMAALLYAGKRSLTQKKGKLEPASPEPEITPDLSKQPKSDTD
jgi:hypothetical protein